MASERIGERMVQITVDEELVPLPKPPAQMALAELYKALEALAPNQSLITLRTLRSMRSCLIRHRAAMYRKDPAYRRRYTCRETDQAGWVRVWRTR